MKDSNSLFLIFVCFTIPACPVQRSAFLLASGFTCGHLHFCRLFEPLQLGGARGTDGSVVPSAEPVNLLPPAFLQSRAAAERGPGGGTPFLSSSRSRCDEKVCPTNQSGKQRGHRVRVRWCGVGIGRVFKRSKGPWRPRRKRAAKACGQKQ